MDEPTTTGFVITGAGLQINWKPFLSGDLEVANQLAYLLHHIQDSPTGEAPVAMPYEAVVAPFRVLAMRPFRVQSPDEKDYLIMDIFLQHPVSVLPGVSTAPGDPPACALVALFVTRSSAHSNGAKIPANNWNTLETSSAQDIATDFLSFGSQEIFPVSIAFSQSNWSDKKTYLQFVITDVTVRKGMSLLGLPGDPACGLELQDSHAFALATSPGAPFPVSRLCDEGSKRLALSLIKTQIPRNLVGDLEEFLNSKLTAFDAEADESKFEVVRQIREEIQNPMMDALLQILMFTKSDLAKIREKTTVSAAHLAEMATLREELARTQEELRQANSSSQALTNALKATTSNAEKALRQQKTTSDLELNKVVRECDTATERVTTLEAELEEVHKSLLDANSSLTKARKDKGRVDDLLKNANAHIVDLQAALDEASKVD